eukprot:scaffold3400_cov169-Amphora_coffeaeformis.AAC.2
MMTILYRIQHLKEDHRMDQRANDEYASGFFGVQQQEEESHGMNVHVVSTSSRPSSRQRWGQGGYDRNITANDFLPYDPPNSKTRNTCHSLSASYSDYPVGGLFESYNRHSHHPV